MYFYGVWSVALYVSWPPPPSCRSIHATVHSPRYLRGRVTGGPVALRRADGVRDAGVILSRRLIALRVRPPRRVAFLNGTRLLETPAAQQISHLKEHAKSYCPLVCTGRSCIFRWKASLCSSERLRALNGRKRGNSTGWCALYEGSLMP